MVKHKNAQEHQKQLNVSTDYDTLLVMIAQMDGDYREDIKTESKEDHDGEDVKAIATLDYFGNREIIFSFHADTGKLKSICNIKQ